MATVITCVNGEIRSVGFSPVYPNPFTKTAEFLAAALSGLKLNLEIDYKAPGTYQPASYKCISKKIGWLMKMGWPLEYCDLELSNAAGRKVVAAVWHLPPWSIQAAGERGQQFGRLVTDINRWLEVQAEAGDTTTISGDE